jgi:hypothetical protein
MLSWAMNVVVLHPRRCRVKKQARGRVDVVLSIDYLTLNRRLDGWEHKRPLKSVKVVGCLPRYKIISPSPDSFED